MTTSTTIHAYAAHSEGADLEPFEFEVGPLGHNEVEVKIQACGVCHSDLSMINNDWGASQYPLVPGHEAIGEIVAMGEGVSHLKVGQMVGVGWNSDSCMHCSPCLSGSQQRCTSLTITIAGRGGFADRIRVRDIWAVPLPDGLDADSAGPLFCGGITVFAPMMDFDLKPTDRIGVIGIGGLGHLAVQFARAWGCEVTAFTTSMDKEDELRELGAHKIVNTKDKDALKKLSGKYDFILSTVNASLAWPAYMAALAPQGKLITVGAVAEPMGIPAFSMIMGQKSVGGSDTGSPDMVARMLEFCVRHDIKPMVEYFDMKDVNKAIERLESGKARYRIILKN
ncbi:NAD(P)-dependent alcohol dehydrogenase [Litorimonas sp. RW-G-Af-16]|uniref:NADPH-dependent aldehyde reductase Ahr n=1 Tax=Litorimonas sp. RW-G-Af-16 TaxID=3241168 RepID=UPI003AAB751E